MKLRNIIFFLLVLPLTLVLDLILYAMIKSCPSCGSFWQFIATEGALSFPIVIGLTEWVNQLVSNTESSQRKS